MKGCDSYNSSLLLSSFEILKILSPPPTYVSSWDTTRDALVHSKLIGHKELLGERSQTKVEKEERKFKVSKNHKVKVKVNTCPDYPVST